MKIETLFEMSSPYRDTFRIRGYKFGEGAKTVAIVGAMRGDEIQQQYICAKIVDRLRVIESSGGIEKGKSVLVIPSCNPFSMNVSHRFWAMDGTDINRMFPGYDKGETTQRIADAVFTKLQGFEFGMQLASFYVPGFFVPHVRMLKTGYEDVEGARLFGMPYVTIREPLPFDTTLLNYNWQIWDTRAYSIYSGQTDNVAESAAWLTINAILRFLNKINVTAHRINRAGYDSVVFDESDLVNVKARDAGILYRYCEAGSHVQAGEVLADILDSYDAGVREKLLAPVSGTIFFVYSRPLALEHGLMFRIIPQD